MNHLARDKANEYALTVEWRGDDYGMRKQYYADAYLAGHAAAWNEIGAYAQQMGLSPEWVSLCQEKANQPAQEKGDE